MICQFKLICGKAEIFFQSQYAVGLSTFQFKSPLDSVIFTKTEFRYEHESFLQKIFLLTCTGRTSSYWTYVPYSDFKSRDQRAHRINLYFVFLFLACTDDLPKEECTSFKPQCNEQDLIGKYLLKYCSKTCDGKLENQLRPCLSLLNKLFTLPPF